MEKLQPGVPTPNAHDGMAAFRHGDLVHLVRNYERNPAPAFTELAYNPGGYWVQRSSVDSFFESVVRDHSKDHR